MVEEHILKLHRFQRGPVKKLRRKTAVELPDAVPCAPPAAEGVPAAGSTLPAGNAPVHPRNPLHQSLTLIVGTVHIQDAVRKEQLSLQADPFPSGKGKQADQSARRLSERRRPGTQLSPDALTPAVNVVACEQLVPAVSGQGYRHMLSGHAAYQIRGDLGGISEGFRKHGRKPGNHLLRLLLRNGKAHVIRSQMGGNPLRRVRFVIFPFLHADGKGAHLSGRQGLHQGNDGAAVNPCRQERPHRNVRHHLPFNGFLQEPLQLVRRLLPASRKRIPAAPFRRLPHGPVGFNGRFLLLLKGRPDGQQTACRKLADVFVDAIGRGNVAVGEIEGKDASVNPPLKAVQRSDASQIGGEDKASRHAAIIQRLFSHPVPCQGQCALLFIPERCGKHSLTQRKGLPDPVVLRRFQQHLRIRSSPEGLHAPFL